ncbi:hypothetical protein Tco_1246692 [Tanacetum coccineum]
MSTSSNSDVEQDTPLGLIVQEVWIQLCHLKARHSGADSNENLKFMEWICFEDMENGTRLLVMMKRTEMKISEKIPFVTFSQLARAAGSDVTKDQLVVLFEREIAESVGKIKEFRRLCIGLRANIRLRNDYISELRLYRSCDDIIGCIALLRTMQLDDRKMLPLLSTARGLSVKWYDEDNFIRRIGNALLGDGPFKGLIVREVFVKLLLDFGKLSIRHGLNVTIVCYMLLVIVVNRGTRSVPLFVVLERDRLKALMDFSLLRPAEDVIHYPRFTKLIIGDLMKKFDSIPKRLEEKYHFIKDNVPLEFVGVYVPMIQPQPVESTQGTHRIPRATRTPNLKDVVQKKRKSKQVVGEPSTPRKSLKKDVKKIVEGEDEESYASEFVDSVFLDEEDTSTRLELRSHKENLEIVDDDDVDEKRDDKKDDDDDNDDDNDDHDDHSLVRTRVTGTTISPTPATTSQDQSKPTSSKTKVLPGSIAQISSDACSSASALQILRTLGSIFTSVYAADQKLKKAYVKSFSSAWLIIPSETLSISLTKVEMKCFTSGSSIPNNLKELPLKITTLFGEIQELKRHVQGMEIELPAKLQTLDTLPSILNKVADTLTMFASIMENASKGVPLPGLATSSPIEGEKNTNPTTKDAGTTNIDLHLAKWREVVQACPDRKEKGWKNIYGLIKTRIEYLNQTEKELKIDFNKPHIEQDPLNELNDLADKKGKRTGDLKDHSRSTKKHKSLVQHEEEDH